MSVPDPFDSYGPPKEDGQIFSVLAPYVPLYCSRRELTSRLGMMDSVPQSPNPNLTRTGSPATSTPERAGSPIKGLTYSKAATPAQAEMSTISAKGENGLWDDDEAGPSVREKGSRARRELSVIDESSSIAQGNEEEPAVEASSDVGEEVDATGPLLDERRDTEDELDETEEEELPDESRMEGDGADDGVSEKLDYSDSHTKPAIPA
jgi:hypothetical protein